MWCWSEVNFALFVIVILFLCTVFGLRIIYRQTQQSHVHVSGRPENIAKRSTRKSYKSGLKTKKYHEYLMSEKSAFSYEPTSEPSLKDLMNVITPFFAPKWQVIGLQLGLQRGNIDAIEHDYPTDCRRCCNRMLSEWLQLDEKPTWQKVQKALKQIELFLREEESQSDDLPVRESGVDLPVALIEVEDPFQGSSCVKLHNLFKKGVKMWNWKDLEEECDRVMKQHYVPMILRVTICTLQLISAVLCVKWGKAEMLLLKNYPNLKESVEDPIVLGILKARKGYAMGCISRNQGNMKEAKKHRNKATLRLYGFNKQTFSLEFIIVNGLDTSLALDKMELLLRYEHTSKFNQSRYFQLRQDLFLKLKVGLALTTFIDYDYMQLYQCYLLLKMATVYLHTYSRAQLPYMHAAKKDIEDAKECLLAVQKTIATVGHMDIWWVIFQGHIVTCDYHYQYGNLDEAHMSLHKVYAVGVVHKLFDSWSVERKLQWIETRRRGIECICNLEAERKNANYYNCKQFLS